MTLLWAPSGAITRECHIGGDFLLIYRLEDEGKYERIYFTRIGTHSELFEG